ncbi:MAG: hypothetical protein MJZ22_05605 [Candidatus Saccharibacteria bacterium]|nr:hypothetical protein [Candidatus Saccharibacteria bacterium]
MKQIDINKKFTEIVSEYLAKGMVFSDSMKGCQTNEVIKVDLTDGKDIFRVRIADEIWSDEDDYGHEVTKIYVERFDADCKRTLWNGDGEQIAEYVYFQLGFDYFTTKEEALAGTEKRIERYQRKRRNKLDAFKALDITSDKAKAIVISAIKRQPRCKTKTIKDIDYVEKTENGKYAVRLSNGSTYILH